MGNIYLILTPIVSCEKNRMSKMAAKILADTKQQLKKHTEESAISFWSQRRKRSDPEDLDNTKKIYLSKWHLFASLQKCQCRNTSSPFYPTLTNSLILIEEYFYLTAPEIGKFVTFDDFGDHAICSIHYVIVWIMPFCHLWYTSKNYTLRIGWKRLHFLCNTSANFQHECKLQTARAVKISCSDFLWCFFV